MVTNSENAKKKYLKKSFYIFFVKTHHGTFEAFRLDFGILDLGPGFLAQWKGSRFARVQCLTCQVQMSSNFVIIGLVKWFLIQRQFNKMALILKVLVHCLLYTKQSIYPCRWLSPPSRLKFSWTNIFHYRANLRILVCSSALSDDSGTRITQVSSFAIEQ